MLKDPETFQICLCFTETLKCIHKLVYSDQKICIKTEWMRSSSSEMILPVPKTLTFIKEVHWYNSCNKSEILKVNFRTFIKKI